MNTEAVVQDSAKQVELKVRESLKKVWEKIKDGGIAPLYEWSAYWNGPRPAKLRIHNDGTVELGYRWDNSTPADEYNGEVSVVYLPVTITRDALKDLFLNDEKFIQYIISVALGNNDRDTGYEMQDYLDALAENNSVNVTTPAEWLEPANNDYESFCEFWSPNESLDDAAEKIYDDAEREGYVLEGSIENELKSMLYGFDCDILKGVHREEADC